IPYELAPELSDEFVLKIERLERFIDRTALVQWKYKGTPLYLTRASEVDQALRRAAKRGDSLYVPAHRQRSPRPPHPHLPDATTRDPIGAICRPLPGNGACSRGAAFTNIRKSTPP